MFDGELLGCRATAAVLDVTAQHGRDDAECFRRPSGYSAGRGRRAGAETNELVLEEVAEDGEAAHASDAARLEAALFEQVVHLDPIVHPDRTGFQPEDDSEGRGTRRPEAQRALRRQ